ncbi:GNAT family N-acetyltransferase [Paenibacillus sp. 481]|uniref:GNAT family N-acetyltransferase n=1 Tax=Paenibacillus sp. 481 TaxID=2835869 RepID=UPI001E381F50|nr:GNAT family N-acetyltransferase [Paenibacillus sp. 481]UHA71834.1 GNAT family N-acetyltransferase [Paenibacillus sp. 481]
MIQIRRAEQSDIPWVNEQYRQIGFVSSVWENEWIAIAEVNGVKAGIGRLVVIDAYNRELGGIYTLEAFRGQKIAHAIVSYLVEEARRYPEEHIYCIPFEQLQSFYGSFGFETIADTQAVHTEVMKKHEWCLGQYNDKTLLMKLY